jgi:hypothetical protein
MQHEPSISVKIIDVLNDGLGMIDDLVLELGMAPNQLSGTLNYLIRARKLVREPFRVPLERRKLGGKSEVYLYSLRSYDRKAA